MKAVLTASVAVLLVLLALTLHAYGDVPGGIAAEGKFYGSLNECEFTVTIDPVSFFFGRVNDKYKLVRIMARNGAEEIRLSAQKDRVDYQATDGRTIPGILDLASHDPQYWESLDIKLREVLAYPRRLKAKDKGQTAFFVFFPAEPIEALRKPTDEARAILPSAIEYQIDSLPKGTVQLRERMKTAA